MSTRTNLRPQIVINAGNMSATTITSDATILQSLSEFSYEVDWTGTSPVGTLALQVSNSYALTPGGTVRAVGAWTTVPLELAGAEVTSIPISGNTGNGFIDVAPHAAYAVRLLYTRVSGTGSMTAIFTGKVA